MQDRWGLFAPGRLREGGGGCAWCFLIVYNVRKVRSAGLGSLVLVVQLAQWVLFQFGVLLPHGLQSSLGHLLLPLGDHLQQLLFPPVPLDLGPLPLIDLLTVAL